MTKRDGQPEGQRMRVELNAPSQTREALPRLQNLQSVLTIENIFEKLNRRHMEPKIVHVS